MDNSGSSSNNKNIDLKRKSRNLSEKKRRDQFNNLINELNNLIDPHFNSNTTAPATATTTASNQNDMDDDDDACSSVGAARQRKMDKSSVLKCAMEFLKKHSNPQQQLLEHCANSLGGDNNSRRGAGDGNGNGSILASSYLDTSLWKPQYITDDEFSVQMLEALDAFIVVCEVNPEARIIYSSDTLTNLLNYTGTCNSLRHYDYVSLFDLVAPNDRQQIEKLFAEESGAEDCAMGSLDQRQQRQQQQQQQQQQSSRHTVGSGNGNQSTQGADLEYKSLIVNFRVGLNLTEIKQKRLRQKGSLIKVDAQHHHQNQTPEYNHDVLIQPYPGNTNQHENNQHHQQTQEQQHDQQRQRQQHQHQSLHPSHNHSISPGMTDGDHPILGHQQQSLAGSGGGGVAVGHQTSGHDIYMDIVHAPTDSAPATCGRGQQSIAEQQQQLLSENHREQQEHNQHLQQRHQQQTRQVNELLQDVDMKQHQQQQHQQQQQQQQHQHQLTVNSTGDDSPLSEGSNVDDIISSGDDQNNQPATGSNSSSGLNSDENDQPSSTGSDDASDSNQSQGRANPNLERRHHYRHHTHHPAHNHSHHHHHGHHHHSHHHSHHHRHGQSANSSSSATGSGGGACNKHCPAAANKSQLQRRHQKSAGSAPNGQQCELVRLMGTFKGFGETSMAASEDAGGPATGNGNNNTGYKFEEPPPHGSDGDGGGGGRDPTNHHSNSTRVNSTTTKAKRYFICIGRLDIPRFSYDLKIIVPPMTGGVNVFHNNQFLSKHTLKWRFLWVDNRAPAIIGYLPFEVLGTSGYDYYHWDDLDKLVMSHETLMREGQACSGPYRFLTKGQQWIWLQTKYCIILKPQCYGSKQKQLKGSTSGDNLDGLQPDSKRLCQNDEEDQVQQQQHQQQQVYTNTIDDHLQQQQQQQVYDGIPQMDTNNTNTYDSYQHHQSMYIQQQDHQGYGSMHSTSASYPSQYQEHGGGGGGGYLGGYHSQDQQQQQAYDDGLITYTVTSPNAQSSGLKRFRSDQQQQPAFTDDSMYHQKPGGAAPPKLGNHPGEQVVDGLLLDERQQHQQANEQMMMMTTNSGDDHSKRDDYLDEQRRYEKLLKSNDLIKNQSIKAGNSFLSRSLDQFKFILCTHTVIGFDESDSLATSSGAAATTAATSTSQQQTTTATRTTPSSNSTASTSKSTSAPSSSSTSLLSSSSTSSSSSSSAAAAAAAAAVAAQSVVYNVERNNNNNSNNLHQQHPLDHSQARKRSQQSTGGKHHLQAATNQLEDTNRRRGGRVV